MEQSIEIFDLMYQLADACQSCPTEETKGGRFGYLDQLAGIAPSLLNNASDKFVGEMLLSREEIAFLLNRRE